MYVYRSSYNIIMYVYNIISRHNAVCWKVFMLPGGGMPIKHVYFIKKKEKNPTCVNWNNYFSNYFYILQFSLLQIKETKNLYKLNVKKQEYKFVYYILFSIFTINPNLYNIQFVLHNLVKYCTTIRNTNTKYKYSNKSPHNTSTLRSNNKLIIYSEFMFGRLYQVLAK
jgi:hypothetical protein